MNSDALKIVRVEVCLERTNKLKLMADQLVSRAIGLDGSKQEFH